MKFAIYMQMKSPAKWLFMRTFESPGDGEDLMIRYLYLSGETANRVAGRRYAIRCLKTGTIKYYKTALKVQVSEVDQAETLAGVFKVKDAIGGSEIPPSDLHWLPGDIPDTTAADQDA